MRYLVISDLHGNWEALSAVLRDAIDQYDQVLCCGDIVGYGADPNPVTEWVREHATAVIRGNHDRACSTLTGIEWFNPLAQAATRWTHQALTDENRVWLSQLPHGPVRVEDFQIVHGSPVDEDEYLVSLHEAREAFGFTEQHLTFFGHTHIQGGFEQRQNRSVQWNPADLRFPKMVDDVASYLVNPGSVGQPRDNDQRAGYALFDRASRILDLRRARYDIVTAQHKIVNAGLPEPLAIRLGFGC